MSCTILDNLFSQAFMVSYLLVRTERDGSGCVKNKNESLREKFNFSLLSHFCTLAAWRRHAYYIAGCKKWVPNTVQWADKHFVWSILTPLMCKLVCIYVGKRDECCIWVCQGFLYQASVQAGWRLKFILQHPSLLPKKEAFPSNSTEMWHFWSFSWALSSLGTFEIQTKTGLIPYVFWRASWLLSQPQLYPHIGHKGKTAAGHTSKKHKSFWQPKTSFPHSLFK